MNRTLKKLAGLLPGVLLLAATAAVAAPAETKKYEVKSGEVVSVWDDNLVTKDADGVMTHYKVPAGQKFVVDGKEIGIGELKPGTKLAAVIETTTRPLTVREETVKNAKVVKARGDRLVVSNETGVKQYDVAAGFRFDIDGRKLRTEQLQEGMLLTATFIHTVKGTATKTKTVVAGSAPKPAPPAPAAPAAAPAPAPAAPVAAAPAPAPEPPPAVAEAKPKKLPKTASPFPLAGLAGVVSLASGLALRARRSR